MRTDKEMMKRCFVEKTWKLIRSGLKGSVLDVGSYDGLLVASHEDSVGIDLVPSDSYIPLVIASMHSLPFKKEIFDTVVMCHVLEHTDKPGALLRETKRVLSANGRLVIAVPNAMAPMARILRSILGYDGYAFPKQSTDVYWKHKIFVGYEEMKSLIEGTEFSIEKFFGSTPHFPVIERIFDLGYLRNFYWKLGDIDPKRAKDLIFICHNRSDLK